MIKNKVFKNLYQSISIGASVAVLILAMLVGFFTSLKYDSNNGWILLAFCVIVTFLFFAIGFYWIFQIVIIDRQGIKVIIMEKVIRNVPWDDVADIQVKTVMRNPAYVLTVRDNKNLNLDKRKVIKTAISVYGNENARRKIVWL